MANSRQRRRSIREQNTAMRKALEKLRRRGESGPAGAASAIGMGPAVESAGPAVTAEAVEGAPAGGGAVNNLLKRLGMTRKEAGRLGKEAVGFALLSGILNTALRGGQMLGQSGVENAQMEAEMAGLSPEAIQESSLQPITRAQRDFALQMLMQQLGGGRGGRARLARGEVMT